MNPAEQNQAIAEACGHFEMVGLVKRGLWWRPNSAGYTAREEDAGRYTREDAARIADDEVSIREFTAPSYTTDLNAMHEAEKHLTEENIESYQEWLDDTFIWEQMQSYPAAPYWLHATASQRAEAFLRTIGKWVES